MYARTLQWLNIAYSEIILCLIEFKYTLLMPFFHHNFAILNSKIFKGSSFKNLSKEKSPIIKNV